MGRDTTRGERPDPAALLGVTEIAERYKVQPNTVSIWQIRHADFPTPLVVIGGRVKVWWAPDVDVWYESRVWV